MDLSGLTHSLFVSIAGALSLAAIATTAILAFTERNHYTP